MVVGFTIEGGDGLRYRAVRVLGSCEHCGMPLPLMGPMREVLCAHCLETNKRSVNFWAKLVDTVDCSPDVTEVEGHEVDIKVVKVVPSAVEATACDAPDWLRSQVQTVRRIIGAQLEGAGGGQAPDVEKAPRPVVMSCPKCSASLSITTENERTTTCEYCQTDIYLPDDLWRRLHPVKKAEHWYIEFVGESPAARRQRVWREQQKMYDEKRARKKEAERRAQLRGELHKLQTRRAALQKAVRLIPLQLVIAPLLFVVMYYWGGSLLWSLLCGGGVFVIHAACMLGILSGKRRELAELEAQIANHEAALGPDP